MHDWIRILLSLALQKLKVVMPADLTFRRLAELSPVAVLHRPATCKVSGVPLGNPVARIMPGPTELEESSSLEEQPWTDPPPPDRNSLGGESDKPEPEYPGWTWFIENPRPNS